ncbi:MAG: hypothetical protein PVI41_09850 [Roseobacter sp.]|jgi:hypothetical protein
MARPEADPQGQSPFEKHAEPAPVLAWCIALGILCAFAGPVLLYFLIF